MKSNLSACIMYGAGNGWMWNESRNKEPVSGNVSVETENKEMMM